MAIHKQLSCLILVLILVSVKCKIDSEGDHDKSGPDDEEESDEHLGATVAQIDRYPYAGSLLRNDNYTCSVVILNTFWLITAMKCFDSSLTDSYITHSNLHNYTLRVGSSYNHKSGDIYKIRMLKTNFAFKITALKVVNEIVFNINVQAIKLPVKDEELSLGYLVAIVAWTPGGHVRIVNAPALDEELCDKFTKLLPGQFICVGGVQDPNRHFCRRDNGGAIVQNNTLYGISSFIRPCAVYTKPHGFPRVSAFVKWLDSIIWDENNRPQPTTITSTSVSTVSTTSISTVLPTKPTNTEYYRYVTLPYEPINLPLEPGEDNSVIPRMSLYESYLRSLQNKAKTSTVKNVNSLDEAKRLLWLKKFNKAIVLNNNNVPIPGFHERTKYQPLFN